jgi:hypothetical protein
MSIVGSHGVNAKRKPLDDIVEKKNRISLGVLLVRREGTDPGFHRQRLCTESGGLCGRLRFASPGISHRPGRDAPEPAFHSGWSAQCGFWHSWQPVEPVTEQHLAHTVSRSLPSQLIRSPGIDGAAVRPQSFPRCPPRALAVFGLTSC